MSSYLFEKGQDLQTFLVYDLTTWKGPASVWLLYVLSVDFLAFLGHRDLG